MISTSASSAESDESVDGNTCHLEVPGATNATTVLPGESVNSVESDDSDTRHFGRRGSRDADPRAFGEFLNYIADRGITIWFDAAGLHWRAYDDEVDAWFLQQLRRFKESLRQAWGPDILPLEVPDPPGRTHGGRRASVIFVAGSDRKPPQIQVDGGD